MEEKRRKILVGMSGGVDSSVAAALLKKQDFQVEGLFLRINGQASVESADILDARKVCEKLKIPLHILDVRTRFQKEVVGYFLAEYAAGRTPNPCVFCNERFKFRLLLEKANELGADGVATGHYARLSREIPNNKFQISNKSKISNQNLKIIFKLQTAKDENKDQSYFLYRLGQEELAKIIFPLGEYTKMAVRELAKDFDLPVGEKKESQDVCFMAGMTTEMFLRKNLKLKKGKIVDEAGVVLGEHNGVALYTIGQRKGINIGGTGPYYVMGKDLEKNKLLVSNDLKKLPFFSEIAILEKMRWINGPPELPLRVLARSRYRNPLVYATIGLRMSADKNIAYNAYKYPIKFDKPEKALASGQSVVFYTENEEILGGGIIK